MSTLLPDNNKYYESSFCLIRPEWFKVEFNTSTGKGIKVALIDSGCGLSQMHDCRVLKGTSFISDAKKFLFEKGDDYTDKLGHGSVCIDIILQIAPEVEILPIKVFNSTLETSTEILVAAMNYAVSNKSDIINLSLGTKLKEALYPLYAACEKAKEKNIICIASNANSDINSYPAIFENVISVSSSVFENNFDYTYNEDELCECYANGFPNDAYWMQGKRRSLSGNSFATPIITGIIALFLDRYGELSITQIRKLLNKYSYESRKCLVRID